LTWFKEGKTQEEACAKVSQALSSKRALARWQRGCQ
jgi:hypothetical protein